MLKMNVTIMKTCGSMRTRTLDTPRCALHVLCLSYTRTVIKFCAFVAFVISGSGG